MGGLGLLVLRIPCSVRLYLLLILVWEEGASVWLVAAAVRAEAVAETGVTGLVASVDLDLWQPVEGQPLHEDPEPATQVSLQSPMALLLSPLALSLRQWRVEGAKGASEGAKGASWVLLAQLGQQIGLRSPLPPIFRMMVILLGQKNCLAQEMQLQVQRMRSCCF